MFGQIIEKKFPLRHIPKIGLFMIVKADQESSDKIELPQVGKGIESFDLSNHTTKAEEARHIAKHRELIQIEAEALVAEQLRDVKKISRAAAKIENAFRAHQVELDLANPANVDIDPAIKFEIFWPVRARMFDGIALANSLEALGVDCFNHSPFLKTKTVHPKKPECMPSCAGQCPAIYKFFQFMGKFFESMAGSHRTIDHTLWRNATISTKLQMA
jgi:hypothetical protein